MDWTIFFALMAVAGWWNCLRWQRTARERLEHIIKADALSAAIQREMKLREGRIFWS